MQVSPLTPSPASRYLCDGHLLWSSLYSLSCTVIVIVIDAHHPDQPAGPDRVGGTDVLTDDHILSLKAACHDH